MEQRGLYIRRDAHGELVTSSGPQGRQRLGAQPGLLRHDDHGAPAQGRAGPERCRCSRRPWSRRCSSATGSVAGVTALDIVRGEFIVIRAKAVIIATGPGNYLATRSTATREQCGNGFAMAYRAGARCRTSRCSGSTPRTSRRPSRGCACTSTPIRCRSPTSRCGSTAPTGRCSSTWGCIPRSSSPTTCSCATSTAKSEGQRALARRVLRRVHAHRARDHGELQLPDAVLQAPRHRHHQRAGRARHHVAHDLRRHSHRHAHDGDQHRGAVRARRRRQPRRGIDHLRELRRNGRGGAGDRTGAADVAAGAAKERGRPRARARAWPADAQGGVRPFAGASEEAHPARS